MATNPRDLTIVSPAYRCVPFLGASVRSALRSGEMPILIVEDHAQDGTLEAAQALAEQNPGRITVFAQPKNLGTTRNWQSTLEMVRTPLVLKLDDDDIIEATYAQAALEFLDQHPNVGIIAGADRDIPEDFGVAKDEAISNLLGDGFTCESLGFSRIQRSRCRGPGAQSQSLSRFLEHHLSPFDLAQGRGI